jgi:hemolysin III
MLSGVGLILLLLQALPTGDLVYTISVAVFGLSLVLLYAASTLYHSAKDPAIRKRWRTADHAAIYVLIAGTYTPFCLVVLPGMLGNTIFAIAWSMAIAGIAMKLFFTGRFKRLSTATYVAMGWVVMFAIKPLVEAFDGPGLYWLIAGGVLYTVGAVIYSLRLPYGHAIFHVFVLAGSFSHFVAVYRHISPAG